MSKLNVIRASAGSGKTHFLTGFFLKTIIKEPVDYFRQILAVTFTNKATAEMKRRILHELDLLAKDEPSDYLLLLIKSTGYKEARIREKCALLLTSILHDYSWFSIETIDSFFQRIIRGFTHEMGIPGNYTIEIETQPVLEFAVDRLLDTLQDNNDCLAWLIRYTEDRIQQGKAWDIRHSILDLGKEVFKEKFSENAEAIIDAITDRKKLDEFRNKLMQTKYTFESRIKEIGNRAISAITDGGFTDDDFYQKSNGPGKFFAKFKSAELKNSAGELLIRTATANKLLDSVENWPSGTTLRKDEVIAAAGQKLLPLLIEAENHIEQNFFRYNTALEILKNIYAVGILADLAEKIKEYRLERNAFILSDAPMLINRIINRNDTPFIYEKMGNRYGHFLIDEFQDTSALQWQNFKPLISNALSQGKNNLLVGDAKQSIYRWRNSNWEILAKQLGNEYPAENIQFEELRTNWRSGEQIVRLIGSLFPIALGKLKNQLQSFMADSLQPPDEIQLLDRIYADVAQEVPKRSLNKGNVFIHFFSNKEVAESDDYYHELLISQLNQLLQDGYSAREIAILVRDRKEGQLVANLLIEFNSAKRFDVDLNILSEDSLFLNVSNAVNLIIAAMQYLFNPQEGMARAKLIAAFLVLRQNKVSGSVAPEPGFDGDSLTIENLERILPVEFTKNTDELISLPLYDLAERLIYIFHLQESDPEIPYIHALLDLLHEYTTSNPANLGRFLEFWEDEGRSKTIPSAESQNAVRILTIHKAKGLEYRAVIIPFCSWKLDQKPNEILWANTKELSFNYLPIVPVNYHRGLKDSEFSPAYYSELFKAYVDNVNLLYVALTRAIETLVVFPVYNGSENSRDKISTVGDLLYESVVHGNNQAILSHFDISVNTFEIRSQPVLFPVEKEPVIDERCFVSNGGVPAMERFCFRTRGVEYFSNIYSTPLKGIRRGSVLHNILAAIETHSDLDRMIWQAVLDGLITAPESQQLKEHILSCFNEGIVLSWFNGSGRAYTEKDILLHNGDIKRPDRVVVFPGKVHVIDYKFGGEKYLQKHRQQVREYIGILENMGYEGIEGFIWYLDQNKVIVA